MVDEQRALVPGEKVCITGASGYVASWITKLFLDAGHPVHATVRNPNSDEKVRHLKRDAELAGQPLTLFAADLTQEGSFDAAMQGCAAVIHVASPFLTNDKVKDAQVDLIAPAEQGTANVLNSASRCSSIRRVVLTASLVSMYGDNADAKGEMVNEESWNDSSTPRHQPYSFSKTVAEKKAWAMAQAQSQWDLITIHPGFITGPSRSKRIDGASVSLVRDMLQGKYKSGFPKLFFGVVDVRDVAQAHLLAATDSNAKGRYICCKETRSTLQIAEALRDAGQGRYEGLPKKAVPKPMLYLAGPFMGFSWKFTSRNVGIPIRFDNQRIQSELGLAFRDYADTAKDHIAQIETDGLL